MGLPTSSNNWLRPRISRHKEAAKTRARHSRTMNTLMHSAPIEHGPTAGPHSCNTLTDDSHIGPSLVPNRPGFWAKQASIRNQIGPSLVPNRPDFWAKQSSIRNQMDATNSARGSAQLGKIVLLQLQHQLAPAACRGHRTRRRRLALCSLPLPFLLMDPFKPHMHSHCPCH